MGTSILHQESSNVLLKSLFKSYYSKAELVEPSDIEMREFAIQPIGYGSYIRHLSFTSITELKSFILENLPLHLYYSSARYAIPAAKEMEEKGWLGSDLLFDVDADEVCKDLKRINFCPTCGSIVQGVGKCPIDGSEVVEYVEINKECLESTIKNTLTLIEILENDFGFLGVVTFSGNRGFHVRVECKDECGLLGQEERKEIVDYIKGEKVPEINVTPDSPSWIGRKVRGVKSVVLDEQVTIDVRRLERVENSINGKSGLLVKRVNDLANFTIDESLSPFNGYVIIIPKVSMKINIFDRVLEMNKNIPIRVEASIGVYLHLKSLGEMKAYVR
ncbi:MAG: DNA primase small subunit PriS [Sulfolobaceae archaeon]